MSRLSNPGPTEKHLRLILEAAVSAPDHKELRPWRFVVLSGPAKDAFGEVLVRSLLQRDPNATGGQQDKERTKLDRAPLVVVTGAKRLETSLPFSELIAATAAATQNMLLAAWALGYGSIWRTGAPVYDDTVKRELGFETDDELVGFIYLGSPTAEPPVARDLRLDGLVTHWTPKH